MTATPSNPVQSCQPIPETPSPQELQEWADEAQAFVDSGQVVISDHRKARATVDALRSHATLKARIEELEGALRRYQDGFTEWRRRAETAEAQIASLQPKAGS
jgi:prefoldin subunit 5